MSKFFKQENERVRSKLYRQLKENHSRELGDREINQYINSEEAYLYVASLEMEVNEVYEKYMSVVELFKQRGFIVTNITKARVAEVHDAQIQ